MYPKGISITSEITVLSVLRVNQTCHCVSTKEFIIVRVTRNHDTRVNSDSRQSVY
jgi:hypothetical protein